MTRKNIKYIMVVIVYGILFIHTHSRYMRIFYFAITIMGIIGMLLSGTRSAIVIPIGGLALYCLISRNIKTIIASIAMGKPVVATSTHTMRDVFTGYTYLATGKNEWISALYESLKEIGDKELKEKRIAFAHTHSWGHSVNSIYQAIEETEKQRRI